MRLGGTATGCWIWSSGWCVVMSSCFNAVVEARFPPANHIELTYYILDPLSASASGSSFSRLTDITIAHTFGRERDSRPI